jgi:hypothetical protein
MDARRKTQFAAIIMNASDPAEALRVPPGKEKYAGPCYAVRTVAVTHPTPPTHTHTHRVHVCVHVSTCVWCERCFLRAREWFVCDFARSPLLVCVCVCVCMCVMDESRASHADAGNILVGGGTGSASRTMRCPTRCACASRLRTTPWATCCAGAGHRGACIARGAC